MSRIGKRGQEGGRQVRLTGWAGSGWAGEEGRKRTRPAGTPARERSMDDTEASVQVVRGRGRCQAAEEAAAGEQSVVAIASALQPAFSL